MVKARTPRNVNRLYPSLRDQQGSSEGHVGASIPYSVELYSCEEHNLA